MNATNNEPSRTPAPDRWPALLRRHRDLASLRHDYPLILVDRGSCWGIESLVAVVNDLLRRIAPRGPAGEKTRRRVLRLEQEIRSLVFRKETGPLSRLWSMASAALSSQPDLSAEERQSLQQDLERAFAAVEVEGELIGCDADTADRVLRHLWQRTQNARAALTGAQLRELAIRLNDVLRSDDSESEESRQPESLKRTFGNCFEELIDFQAMSRTLRGNRPHARIPAKRRERIEWALAVLREEKFFSVEADTGRHPFAFASCSGALAELKRRLPRMADLLKAIRIAALEIENRYRDEIHNPLFGHFDAGSLTAEDIRWFPSYLVLLRERDCDPADRTNLIEILSSELPIKVVFQVDNLFQDANGQPAPDTAAWRTQLAGMAVNLGSAFVLQTATSNFCTMAQRLADGLAAAGPALFCLFSPGGDSPTPPYLTAAAAMESRLFPTLVFDPGKGETLAECFSLDGNPQPDRDWPVHSFSYEDEQMQSFTDSLAFTAVDFLAADHSFADAFQPLPQKEWAEAVPLAQYLQDGDGQNRVPFVLVVGPDDRLQRLAVTPAAVRLAQRTARRWHRLQELGGINNSHSRRALDEAHQAWESEKQKLVEESRRQSAPQTELPAEHPAIVSAAAAAQANDRVEATASVSHDEAWIETARCTSCNECTNRNNRMFTYNENKQARIADLQAGTYRELVEAAEACKVAIIRPGKPWNPDEPHLEELLRRAEAFR